MGYGDVNEDAGQENARLNELADERFGWWNARRTRSYRKSLFIGAVVAALILIVLGLCWTVRLLDQLEVSCARDDRGKGACTVYFEQTLPTGCPPDCQGLELQGVVLSGIDMNWTDFKGADLFRAYMVGTDLRRAHLESADLRLANLYRAQLDGAGLRYANLVQADLTEAALGNARLYEADLREASLLDADLFGAALARADLRGADLRGADLRGADLTDVRLSGAQLEGAVYNLFTLWPSGFDPAEAGLVFQY
jgi:hypothetical protein